MKKTIAAIICLLLAAACLTGCVPSSAAQKPFRCGYAIRDIMPAEDAHLPLGGYGNTQERLSDFEHVPSQEQDRLKVTCIALEDRNGEIALFLSFDMCRAKELLVKALRRTINWRTGVPEDHIMVNASHSHSAPDLTASDQGIYDYESFLLDEMTQAAVDALDDLQEVTSIKAGSIETNTPIPSNPSGKYMNYTRHYYYEKNGTKYYYGDNFGTRDTAYTAYHTINADPTMFILKFERKAGKPVLLVNWRAHPHRLGGSTNLLVTADAVGYFRYCVNGGGDYLMGYYQGAAGMTNSHSRITSDMPFPVGSATTIAGVFGNQTSQEMVNNCMNYANCLADYVDKCVAENMQEMAIGDLNFVSRQLIADNNKADIDKIAEATEMSRILNDTSTGLNITDRRAAANAYGLEHGIRSIYHANAINSRVNFPESRAMELNTITIGRDVLISTVPYEMFHETSEWLEEQATGKGGFKYAFTMGYCNDHLSYMPTETVWGYTSYETDITPWARGTAEKVVYELCKMANIPYEEDCP